MQMIAVPILLVDCQEIKAQSGVAGWVHDGPFTLYRRINYNVCAVQFVLLCQAVLLVDSL